MNIELKNGNKKCFRKRFFQFDEQCSVSEKTKKKLFGVRTKLLYNKNLLKVVKKLISNRNEKNIYIFTNKPVY